MSSCTSSPNLTPALTILLSHRRVNCRCRFGIAMARRELEGFTGRRITGIVVEAEAIVRVDADTDLADLVAFQTRLTGVRRERRQCTLANSVSDPKHAPASLWPRFSSSRQGCPDFRSRRNAGGENPVTIRGKGSTRPRRAQPIAMGRINRDKENG